MRGRNIEMEYFHNQHVVDIFLLNETFIKPGKAFQFANYVCNRTERELGRYSHTGPPWYSPPLRARYGSNPLGGCCHSSHIG